MAGVIKTWFVSVCIQSSDLSRRREENAEEKAVLSRRESERSITVKVWFSWKGLSAFWNAGRELPHAWKGQEHTGAEVQFDSTHDYRSVLDTS